MIFDQGHSLEAALPPELVERRVDHRDQIFLDELQRAGTHEALDPADQSLQALDRGVDVG